MRFEMSTRFLLLLAVCCRAVLVCRAPGGVWVSSSRSGSWVVCGQQAGGWSRVETDSPRCTDPRRPRHVFFFFFGCAVQLCLSSKAKTHSSPPLPCTRVLSGSSSSTHTMVSPSTHRYRKRFSPLRSMATTALLLAVGGGLGLGSVSAASSKLTEPSLVPLDTAMLTTNMRHWTTDYAVMFYAPWCQHCR